MPFAPITSPADFAMCRSACVNGKCELDVSGVPTDTHTLPRADCVWARHVALANQEGV